MSAYHILKRVTDQGGTYYVSVPVNVTFTTQESVMNEAKRVATKYPSETLLIVQEIGKVSIEPVVTMILEPPQPKVVYRDGVETTPLSGLPPMLDNVPEGPKRDPQTKPRLLVIDRKATPAEITGYLMVVAEGRIVKNAFGALEPTDMPLIGSEVQEVANALRRNLVV